jgi:HlyD family secretion protein
MTNPYPAQSDQSWWKSGLQQSLKLVIVASIGILGFKGYELWQNNSATVPDPAQAQSPVLSISTVTALGHLEPQGEIVALSAANSQEGNRLEQLLVKEGDYIKKGQVIAILDNHLRLQAAVVAAKEQIRLEQANLAKVKAGAQTGQIEAQKAAVARIESEQRHDIQVQTALIRRLEVELNYAQVEYQRYELLYNEGAVSASNRDSKRLISETTQQQLYEAKAALERTHASQQQQIQEAKATLSQIVEVRPVDVEVAAARVATAQAAWQQAQANLQQAFVRSLQNGRVIKIHTFPGEVISDQGIVEIGQTQQMYAIGEIYESDISKIRVGQKAKISSPSLTQILSGTVEKIGLQVIRQDVINADPSANIDSRVVEVKIRIDPSFNQQVADLTHLQVQVTIEL